MEGSFFNVHHNIRIAGRLYVTAVSYKVESKLLTCLKELQEAGKVHITDHQVVFQNGVPLDKEDNKAERAVFKA